MLTHMNEAPLCHDRESRQRTTTPMPVDFVLLHRNNYQQLLFLPKWPADLQNLKQQKATYGVKHPFSTLLDAGAHN